MMLGWAPVLKHWFVFSISKPASNFFVVSAYKNMYIAAKICYKAEVCQSLKEN